MAEDRRKAEGMGAHPSGPSFDAPPSGPPDPSSSVAGSTARQPFGGYGSTQPTPRAEDFRPPARRLPAVLTALAVVVVGGVVVLASVSAPQNAAGPSPSTTNQPVTARPAPSTAPANETSFSTPYGDGVLTVVGHTWSTGTGSAARHALLTVRVRIRAVAGEIDVDPTYFQILDQAGAVYENVPSTGGQRELQTTTLAAGESVAGGVMFDAPRGDMTLLMGDGAQGITAIRVPA